MCVCVVKERIMLYLKVSYWNEIMFANEAFSFIVQAGLFATPASLESHPLEHDTF